MIRVKSARGFLDVSLVALLVLTLWRVAIPHASTARDYPALQVGGVLDVPEINWSDASRHVVLMISTTCLWCAKSADWYRGLSSELSKQPATHLLILHREEASVVKRWLDERQIVPKEIVRVSDVNGIGLSETPTALIVDSTGKVTDGVLGMLTPAEESAFRARYLGVAGARPVTNIPNEVERSTFVDMLAHSGALQVIDIRDRKDTRDRKTAALVMPIDEIMSRAPIELSANRPVAVDCLPGWMQRCRLAARVIHGYVPNVVVARP